MRERPISSMPKSVLLILVTALFVQLWWHHQQAILTAKAENLSAPPSLSSINIASFGEQIAVSKSMMLYLQVFDAQAGMNLSFRQLDYAKVLAWLNRIAALDPQAQYPSFSASNLYGEVKDDAKQRIMLNFVYQQFLLDPSHRWKYLAHAAVLAKHRLKDLALAHQYAQAIRLYATDSSVPHWAQQMDIFLLEDMDELESAKILLGGLLQNGQITDPHELHFLEERMIELDNKNQNASKTQP